MVQERPVRVERRLSAILAADVAGYSRLMHSDEETTHAKLTALLAGGVEPAIAEHGGRIVKNTGDGMLWSFRVSWMRCPFAASWPAMRGSCRASCFCSASWRCVSAKPAGSRRGWLLSWTRPGDRQQALSWKLRTATNLARLWGDQNRATEARKVLGSVYGRFTEGFETADLREAKSQLQRLT